MTDKLKCPFCGAELETDNEIARLIMWRCHTPGCLLNGWHSAEIIQHLIDGKKAQDALEIAVDALKEYEDRDSYDCDGNWCGCEHSTAHKALTKITALEQKDE